jgi:hypothetical protein
VVRGAKAATAGPGGGGLGGHSLTIAFSGTPVTKAGTITLTPGTAGLGGPGGSGDVAMNAGDDGVAAEEQELP